MSDDSDLAMNILDLPLEVLEMIISYVPDQLTVAPTCKSFYEISCRLKRYKITVNGKTSSTDPRGLNVKELEEDESLLQSIVNTKRKIKTMSLYQVSVGDFKHFGTLTMLFESFKHNLSTLRLHQCQLSVEQFVDLPGSFQLNLPNLKELIILQCPPEVLDIFNHLPDNVLTKVVVSWCRGYIGSALKNQREIKELSWTESGHLAIDTRNLQLHSLELNKECYSRELLTGQGSLTSLTLNFEIDEELQQADIDTISTLEHLEYLEFHIGEHILNLSELQKLSNLKQLIVCDVTNHGVGLERLKSFSVTDLVFISNLYDRRFLSWLSNCPNIRNLAILPFDDDLPGSLCLKTVLEKLPKLEYFSTSWPLDFTLSIEFEHHNLKRLTLGRVSISPEFKTLLENCVALENLEILETDWELLNIILTVRPNLKVLCVEDVKNYDEEFFDAFWVLVENLKSFHIKWKSGVIAEELTDGCK